MKTNIHYKHHKVVLASVEEETRLIRTSKGFSFNYRLVPFFQKDVNKYMYILSDDEIKLGDYYIDFTSSGPKLEYFAKPNDWMLVGICDSKKVIATNNKNLDLPYIPDEFIHKYCEFGGIDNIRVVYEGGEKLALDTRNRIEIKLIKKSWDEKEIDFLLNKAIGDFTHAKKRIQADSNSIAGFINEWKKTNLI